MASTTVVVKYGKDDLPIEIPLTGKVLAVKQQLESLTGLFVRKQKLIYKGKVLEDGASLDKYKITVGSKLMLLASETGPSSKANASAASTARSGAAVPTSLQELLKQRTGQTSLKAPPPSKAPASGDLLERKKTWQKTGVVALRDLGLTSLPDNLLTDLPSARLADLCHNQLPQLHPYLSSLTSLQTLKLSNNKLTDEGMPWAALASLPSLGVLLLDSNCLTTLPECVSGLKALGQLNLSRNQLVSLPGQVSGLRALQVLHMAHNKLPALPEQLASCSALLELEASHNAIADIPASFSSLTTLQSLRLDSNRVPSVPAELLAGCSALHALALHDNPITADQLRSTPGFAEYEARRRARCDKQLEAAVLIDLDRSFTEGADQQQWQHWK